MSEPAPSTPSDRRVAVVVVAGVGDAPRSDAAQRVASGLVVCAGFEPPTEDAEWFEASGAIEPVQRFATSSPTATRVDLYEFWWADLSRFPAALRSFLAAFVGLFLAFPAIGRTALRADDRITKAAQTPPAGVLNSIDYRLLGVLAWLVAIPVVVVSATVLLTAGGLLVSLWLPEPGSPVGIVALALYVFFAALAGLALIRHYENRSGRRPAFALAIVAFAAAAAVFGSRLVERGTSSSSIELVAADTVTELVAYGVRVVWLAVLVAAFLTTIVLGLRLLAAWKRGEDRRGRTLSALITLAVGPLGIAILMAIFSAAIGAAGQRIGKGTTWAASATPLCLPEPDHWRLRDCHGPLTAWDFGSRLLANAIYSLASALAVAGMTVAILAAVALVQWLLYRTSTSDRAEPQAGRLTRLLGVVESPATCMLVLLASLGASYAGAAAWLPFLPFLHLSVSETAWGPTVAAILGGGVTVLLVVGRALGLSPTNLASGGKAPGVLRTLLDKPYDIATFLREPLGWRQIGAGVGDQMPRQKMLERYEALMAYIGRRSYERVVFVAHSQGTVLTTTLLADDQVELPADEVSLMTFGCPLRQLYLQRFPSQYAWVNALADPSQRATFVTRVNREWVNVAAAGDPIGRTIFQDPPNPWQRPLAPLPQGSPKITELILGRGGHGSYWTAPDLYGELARLIDSA